MSPPGPNNGAELAFADAALGHGPVLDAIARLCPYALVAVTLDGVVLLWSRQAEAMYGWSCPEVVGRPAPFLSPSDLAAAITHSGGHDAETVQPSEFETRTTRRDGSLCDTWIRVGMMRDCAGGATGFLLYMRELTDERRKAARQEALDLVIRSIREASGLSDVLRQVRDAAISIGGFDRAGVFTVDGDWVQGAWGTGADGSPRDESWLTESISDWGEAGRLMVAGRDAYCFGDWQPLEGGPMLPHAVIALRAAGDLVGLMSVDNNLSGRSLMARDVERFLAFADQAAIAIRSARLIDRQQNLLGRQRRFAEIAAAIAAQTDLDTTMRMVRDAVVDVGAADRAGVYTFDSDTWELRGSWGTDRDGRLVDERDYRVTLYPSSPNPMHQLILSGGRYRLFTDMTAELDLQPGDVMYGVRGHGTVALRCGDETVGTIVVDNAISGKPLTLSDIESLADFAGQAAVAIRQMRMGMRQADLAARQHRVTEISAAIAAETDLYAILRMVRDAAIEIGGFDRAGVGMYDPVRRLYHGAWGTDGSGQPVDERDLVYGMSDPGSESIVELMEGDAAWWITDDYTSVCEVAPNNPMFGVRGYAMVPLRSASESVGALSVDNVLSGRPVVESDIELIVPVAQHAAVAIRQARLVAQVDAGAARQRRFGEIAAAIAMTTDLSDIMRMVRDAAVEIGGFARAAVWTYDVEEHQYTGWWGTADDGAVRDERGVCVRGSMVSREEMAELGAGARPYVLNQDYTTDLNLTTDHFMYGVRAHCTIPIRFGGAALGVVTVDNGRSDRPISDEDLRPLVPLADQAAVAIRNAALLAEQRDLVARQTRLAEVAAAIAEMSDLSEIMRLVRDAAVEVGGFDRAGVWTYDDHAHVFSGWWGTDKDGKPQDERGRTQSGWELSPSQIAALGSDGPPLYIWADYTEELGLGPSDPMYGVRGKVSVTMRSGSQVLGVISVDNAVSGRPVRPEDAELLVPFADQAAIAIRNARLIEQQRMALSRQQRFAIISAAIAAVTDLDAILRMVRDSVADVGGFDRVSVWMLNDDHTEYRGYWGTGLDGTVSDEHDRRLPVIPTGRGPLSRIATNQDIYVMYSDYAGELGLAQGHDMAGVRAHAAVSMRCGDEPVGAITVDNALTDRPISESDILVLVPFAEQAAVAIRQAGLLDEITKQNRELEHRVEERTARLEDAVEELQRFTYTVAHDLRAPLRAIDGYAHLVMDQLGSRAGEDVRRFVEHISGNALTMGMQIDGLLAFSRLSRRVANRQAVDMRAAARRAWDRASTDRAGRDTEFVLDELPDASADPDMVDELFSQLLSNATKFTVARTTAVVAVGVLTDSAPSGAPVYFVRDNGIGFEQEYADRAFGVFERLHRMEDYQGTGMGLAIVRRIIDLHGGWIEAKAAPGQGAAFYFTLEPPGGALMLPPS